MKTCIMVAIVAILSIPASLCEGQAPDYTLRFGSTVGGAPGDTVPVRCLLDVHAGAGTVPGWSFSVCSDAPELQPVAVHTGSTMLTANGGLPPDYIHNGFYPGDAQLPGGVTQGVVISFWTDAYNLPVGDGYELLVIDYLITGPPDSLVALEYCDDAQIPNHVPVETVVVSRGTSYFPERILGIVPIHGDFLRGDADDDGTIGFPDIVALLDFLFGGGAFPECLDAADGNDDSAVDIGDPINGIAELFGMGGGPIYICETDPSPDAIPCVSFVSCP
jgi:hypothetical protein